MARRKKTVARRRRTSAKRRFIFPTVRLSSEQKQDIWGTLFLVIGALSFFILSEQLGAVGHVVGQGFFLLFGLGAYGVPVVFGLIALSFFFTKGLPMNMTRFFGLLCLFLGGFGLVHTVLVPIEESFDAIKYGGGFFGATLSFPLRHFLTDIGAYIVLIGLTVIGMTLIFPISIGGLAWSLLSGTFLFLKALVLLPFSGKKEKKSAVIKTASPPPKPKPKKVVAPEPREERPLVAKIEDWDFPSLELLETPKEQATVSKAFLQQKGQSIVEKLAEFGIGCDLEETYVGPTVTQFTIRPHEGVKLTKIVSLKNDLALALATESIRIEAPVPGKDVVGIEIPNEKRSMVTLREILQSDSFSDIESSLRMALGKDVGNVPMASDLAEMPHLLIAGATGSGKSVGVNTFLISLLYQNSPADLKMILIDPKRVELAPYNNIPHLLTPVITEADKALAALKWAVAEMMRRYGELANKNYRNVSEYNAKEEEKMPKIVIVVDELADLMMRQFKKETEAAICRLAQMARAVGMHLIIATQRPSVDVITGLIKANIPTRIAFAVTSSVDSRTILDSVGAEDLLGKGDMLLSTPSMGKPKRIQGIFVSTAEVQKVINHLKVQETPDYDHTIIEGEQETHGGSFAGAGAGGSINEQATEVIRETGKASASLLQRRLSIGYARAARILDELEEEGIIGPANGAKPREIYL